MARSVRPEALEGRKGNRSFVVRQACPEPAEVAHHERVVLSQSTLAANDLPAIALIGSPSLRAKAKESHGDEIASSFPLLA